MRPKTVSILGCGWVGKPLGRALAVSGHRVSGSTTKEANIAAIEASGLAAFVLNVDELTAHGAHSFFECDVLVISLPQGTRAGKGEEYLGRIKKIIALANRGNVNNIILVSTTSVYPNLNRVVLEEDADAANSIVQAESIVRKSGIPATILRFAGLFGPGRHPGKFLAGKTDVSGGNSPVNLIHLDDCVQIIKVIIENNVWNEVLNACADGHPTRRDFYTHAALELGLEPPIFSEDAEPAFKIVSNERLKSVLKYAFIHPISVR